MPGRRFFWQPFNATYGPWFRMMEVKEALAVPLEHSGHAVDATVQPDMDRNGWYWSVCFRAYRPKLAKADKLPKDVKKRAAAKKVPLPEVRLGGKVHTPGDEGRAEAMRLAEQAFLSGRPHKEISGG